MNKNTQCYYTIGRVISKPATHTYKGSNYLTAYVELFGGMTVSALTGKQSFEKDAFVGVRITPKGNGEAAYHAYALNDKACDMIRDAADFVDSDGDDLLPF